MKLQRYLAGVLLIALLVAGTLLTASSWLTSFAAPATETEANSVLPSDGSFQINLPMAGKVTLQYGASGELGDNLKAPTANEQTSLPDLGQLDLGLLLNKGSGSNVSGYVDLAATLVFTGYHTINTNITGTVTTLTVGPKVSGTYQNGILNLLSERVSYATDSGETIERQFRLKGIASQTPGVLKGEYRETVWGYSIEPLTVVGTFELKDLKVTLATKDTNQAPTANALTLTTKPNTAVVIKLTGSDPEGKALTFMVLAKPINGSVSGTAPNLTYTPKKDFQGVDSFTFKVNDGDKDSDAVAVTIKVTTAPPVNTPPVANALTVSVVQGKAKAITLTGSDSDGDPLTFAVVTQPSHGKLTGTAPQLTYTPNAGFTGTDSFTYKVNDGKVDSPAAKVSINVKAPTASNNAPDASAQSVTTEPGKALAITLSADDADGDSVTFIIVNQPSHGKLTGTPPNLTYTPDAGFTGTDSFTFKANDGQLDSAVVKVTITVDSSGVLYLPMTVNTKPASAATIVDSPIITTTITNHAGSTTLYIPMATR